MGVPTSKSVRNSGSTTRPTSFPQFLRPHARLTLTAMPVSDRNPCPCQTGHPMPV
jgi:hypothetical protein